MAHPLAQPDLFGQWDAEQERLARQRVEQQAWAARFRRVSVTIAYESAGGMRPGDVFDGVACPACGGIEFNSLLLATNHGWAPDMPYRTLYGRPAFETCSRLRFRTAQPPYDGIGVVRLPDGQHSPDSDRPER